MFIDDYGNEFETIEEAKKFFAEKFNKEMEESPCDTLLECIEDADLIIEWIVKKRPELLKDLKEEFANEIKKGQKNYIENGLWDLEEIE
jgi:hypothetical protein